MKELESRKGTSGFSLIELLVVLGIIAVLSGVSLMGLSRYNIGKGLDLGIKEVMAAVQATQKRAISQEGGHAWGVHFVNSTSGESYYQIFSGPSFASGTVDRTIYLKRGIVWGNPAPSSTVDVVFAAVSGKPSQTYVISVVNTNSAGLSGNMYIDDSGTIKSDVEKKPLGYWHFDEGTSTAVKDSSGWGNDLTYINYISWRSGPANCKAGSCLYFDWIGGFDGLKNYSIEFVGKNSFSFLTWAKWYWRNNTWYGIMGQYTYYMVIDSTCGVSGIRLYPDGRVDCAAYTNSPYQGWTHAISPAGAMQADNATWYHLACVYDGAKLTNYINGVAVASSSLTGNLALSGLCYSNPPHAPFAVGIDAKNTMHFTGTLDEPRIYNEGLSAGEVLDIYNDTK